jgi:hypothetical protein
VPFVFLPPACQVLFAKRWELTAARPTARMRKLEEGPAHPPSGKRKGYACSSGTDNGRYGSAQGCQIRVALVGQYRELGRRRRHGHRCQSPHRAPISATHPRPSRSPLGLRSPPLCVSAGLAGSHRRTRQEQPATAGWPCGLGPVPPAEREGRRLGNGCVKKERCKRDVPRVSYIERLICIISWNVPIYIGVQAAWAKPPARWADLRR